ncbi:GAF domain-containing protein [Clostridium grantii]|uniref:GAF domain-containing protein n=1 Tax=Clostridium grantii DSM 8605 TaxID=1121316 RepID=A0A1M5W0I7_9CLOT|nr:GAF domain-containing protein [Clostridium grantii]SHH80981.1 GAF domain-containing protein [Clostridium grantii DSM 8605]
MDFKKNFFSVLETILFNVIVYYIFFILQSNQEVYLNLNPHPLFILSIVMGLRYGKKMGFVSACISVCFFVYVFLQINKDINLLVEYFNNYKYILLFLWSAVVLGTFKDNYTSNIKKQSDEINLLEESFAQLKKDYSVSEKIQKELKRQIISSEESIISLYDIASKLETFETEELYTETIGILAKYLRATAISIYYYSEESNYLRLKISYGNEIEDRKSLLITNSKGFSQVIYKERVVRWQEIEEEDFPLMSAPLVRNNKVIAVVNIENMDFDRISEYAFQLFKLIMDWVNKSLNQAIYIDEMKESKYIKETKLMKINFFQERLKVEEQRKKDFGMDFGLLKYKVFDLSLQSINDKATKSLRSVDIISYDINNKILFILVPATAKENLYIVEDRILTNFKESITKIS